MFNESIKTVVRTNCLLQIHAYEDWLVDLYLRGLVPAFTLSMTADNALYNPDCW